VSSTFSELGAAGFAPHAESRIVRIKAMLNKRNLFEIIFILQKVCLELKLGFTYCME